MASLDLLRGSEHPFIIDATITNEISSRASSKLIKINPNTFLDMLFVFYKLLSGDHSCQDIMSRESRPKIAPYSISSLISKSLHINLVAFTFLTHFWKQLVFLKVMQILLLFIANQRRTATCLLSFRELLKPLMSHTIL